MKMLLEILFSCFSCAGQVTGDRSKKELEWQLQNMEQMTPSSGEASDLTKYQF
jgi:hypothetical protein